MADVALVAGAQLVVNDIQNIRNAVNVAGTIQTAAGTLSAVPVGKLAPLLTALQTDTLALLALMAADPGVP